jgi:hypothetical protein
MPLNLLSQGPPGQHFQPQYSPPQQYQAPQAFSPGFQQPGQGFPAGPPQSCLTWL